MPLNVVTPAADRISSHKEKRPNESVALVTASKLLLAEVSMTCQAEDQPTAEQASAAPTSAAVSLPGLTQETA